MITTAEKARTFFSMMIAGIAFSGILFVFSILDYSEYDHVILRTFYFIALILLVYFLRDHLLRSIRYLPKSLRILYLAGYGIGFFAFLFLFMKFLRLNLFAFYGQFFTGKNTHFKSITGIKVTFIIAEELIWMTYRMIQPIQEPKENELDKIL